MSSYKIELYPNLTEFILVYFTDSLTSKKRVKVINFGPYVTLFRLYPKGVRVR